MSVVNCAYPLPPVPQPPCCSGGHSTSIPHTGHQSRARTDCLSCTPNHILHSLQAAAEEHSLQLHSLHAALAEAETAISALHQELDTAVSACNSATEALQPALEEAATANALADERATRFQQLVEMQEGAQAQFAAKHAGDAEFAAGLRARVEELESAAEGLEAALREGQAEGEDAARIRTAYTEAQQALASAEYERAQLQAHVSSVAGCTGGYQWHAHGWGWQI